MVKRCEVVGLALATTVCVLLMVTFNQKSKNFNRNEVFPEGDHEFFFLRNYTQNVSIKYVIQQQQTVLEHELEDYAFPKHTNLEDYTLTTGGKPIRNVIITTWRSGSTFLGDVINAMPGNYYHYEPLLDYGIMQIRGPPYADSAIANLKKLLMCNYSDLYNYLEYGKTHIYLFTHNTRLWNKCEAYPQFCWNATFLSAFCKLFPFQSMKVVRLRLKLAEELLRDTLLNTRILLLVRDPRGILQSRRHRDWCPGIPDCDDPNLLCADMVADYSAAITLQKLYPTRFRAIRYEDLSMDPQKNTEELFKFFDLYFHPQVGEFLDSHTKLDVGGVSSTFRNSKSAPYHWRMDLNFSEVQFIEDNCDEAMKLWGYVRAVNESHLREFNPLTNYTIS